MRDGRSGGIVAAVALAIAAAFVATMLLIVHQNLTIAQVSAEDATRLYATELSASMSGYMHVQDSLVSSGLLDGELASCLQLEAQGEDPNEVAASLSPHLRRLVVDEEQSETFVVSATTGNVYYADGTWMAAGSQASGNASVEKTGQTGGEGTYLVTRVPGRDGRDGRVAYRHELTGGNVRLGYVCLEVKTSSLADILTTHGAEDGRGAACFLADGTVLFSTPGLVGVGTNVFVACPDVAGLAGRLVGADTAHLFVWTGLEGLLPQSQRLYDVSYMPDFNMYLLATNTAAQIFSDMRARTTTLVLALAVVMILLMLLVVTIVRWYRARLIEAATTDELTGLANRKSFAGSYERFVQDGAGPAATLALIDVDRFKQVNDGYGHAAGDHALAAVAAEVRAMVGPDGLAGRWGGDEFIAVLCHTGDDARQRVQAMIRRVADCQFAEGFAVSVSVGTTTVDCSELLEKMVEQADDALYVTKENGRGFLTEYEAGVTPHMVGEDVAPRVTPERVAATDAVGAAPDDEPVTRAGVPRGKQLMSLLANSLLEAVHKMVPFVAGGGILIAIAFLIDGANVDMGAMSAETRASFGSITPIAKGLHDVGAAAFNFMLPIFAAHLARGLAGDEAFMAGFAGGFLSSQGSAGFAGAICAALVSALVVHLMRNFVDEASEGLRRVAPVLLYPVFSLLIMYLLMTFGIEPMATAFDAWLTSLLAGLRDGGSNLLGFVCGAMMATDMGGPINKAAYHFGTAAIAQGSPEIMASVMVGGMVPPCGIAVCMLLFRSRFTAVERDQAAATLFMGLSFITEGAIPFVLTDFARVIPSCMLGSGIAGACSMAFGCTLMAPHGGLFVFPVVGNAGWYLLSLGLGTLCTAVALGLLKRSAKA